MVQLRARSVSYREIAERYGITTSTAYEAVQRTIKEGAREATEEIRAIELEKLEHMERAALGVLEAMHLTVSHGKVVTYQGKPLKDPGPALGAIDRLLKVQQRRAALLGLDLPKQVQISGGVRYEVVGVDPELLT